jgi:AAA domain
MSDEQREAVRFITSERSIEALTGFAGAGKSAAIAAARDPWQAEGYRVLLARSLGLRRRTCNANRGSRAVR